MTEGESGGKRPEHSWESVVTRAPFHRGANLLVSRLIIANDMKSKSMIAQIGILLAVAAQVLCAQTPPIEIPLQKIHVSFRQPGLQLSPNGPAVIPGRNGNAPAVMGLTWAVDFDELTKLKLTSPSGDAPLELAGVAKAEAELWAGVYFGSTGSTPPQFAIDSVQVHSTGLIELRYHRAPAGIMTMDLRPYFAWLPLGKLAAGNYTLRLVEAGVVKAEQKWSVPAAVALGRTESIPVSPFVVTPRKPQDKVQAQLENGRASLAITSPSGIGGAVVKPTQGRWPTNLVVRLRYDAERAFERLEGFNAVAEGGVRYDEIRGRATAQWMEVELPAKLLQSNPASIELSWVDMYR